MKSFTSVIEIINIQVFFFSALLFFIGYAFAPTAYYKKIKWLTAYPFYIIKVMDSFFKKKHHPLKIFMIIFLLNSFSLFINLISAWGVILPFLVIIYMGINIGIVMYHSLGGKFYYLGLLNPVAILELPAAWLSITMSIQFSLSFFFHDTSIASQPFSEYVLYFISTVVPLLFVAGVIETFLIVKASMNNKLED
jgi:uncharacterized membrane protein SpoIIM required for sporulation